MSDFSFSVRCPYCGGRFAPNDGSCCEAPEEEGRTSTEGYTCYSWLWSHDFLEGSDPRVSVEAQRTTTGKGTKPGGCGVWNASGNKKESVKKTINEEDEEKGRRE